MRLRNRAAAWAGLLLASVVAVSGAAVAVDQNYYWRWSDGSTAATRTFTVARYGIASNLPTLIVTAQPAVPRREVRLQFYSKGSWITESTARTDSRGVARMALDPRCGNLEWCDTTLRYQLLVGGQNARLTITYDAG